LLPLLAHPAIVDVRYHAHDLDVGFDVDGKADANQRAERTPAAHAPLHERFVHDRQAAAALAHRSRIALVKVPPRDDTGAEGREESRGDRIQMDFAVRGGSPAGLNRQAIIPSAAGQ
jgi:hypothetical protein